MSHERSASHRGRIRPDQRNTDDTTPTIEGPGLRPEHEAAIFSTEDKSMSDGCRRNYRNRIRRMIEWMKDSYPDVFEQSVRVVTNEERDNAASYYWPDDEHDFKYAGLNPQYIKAFLADMKVKPNGRIYGYSHMSKFYDAIKWGCGRTTSHLSTSFYTELDKYMASYKKDYTTEKKKGNVDENEADAISSPLFQLLMKWAVLEGNVFVWCFALLMWNLMARSINVDCIALHSIKRGMSDSITFKYDETKMDKTGEFVQEKNCYSNPFNPFVCIFTALGCYLSIYSETLEKTELLFLLPGRKGKTAAQNFARQISAIGERYANTIKSYLRLSHFNIHGLRKGSGTHAASATTCPPLFTSIACRGEWSMGKILDIYFRFAAGGDYYLGQLLSLKDAMSPQFATPCPHWIDPTDERVLEAMRLTFGKVLVEHEDSDHDPYGFLSLLLASMVYHCDWMLQICSDSAHPFNQIPLLSSPLLKELRENCLTMELNEHVPRVTGIPPHVVHSCELKEVKEQNDGIIEQIGMFRNDIKEAVSDAIDAKVEADGNVNSAILQASLKGLEERLMQKVDELTNGRNNAVADSTRVVADGNEVDLTGIGRRIGGQYDSFMYDGRFWPVPKDFIFPIEVTRLHGWRIWCTGKVHVQNGQTYKLKPFHLLRGKDLPNKQLVAELDNKWKPIFKKMQEAPGIPDKIPVDADESFVQDSFARATDYLKQNVSYIWSKAKNEADLGQYKIATWSKKVQYNSILKHGSPEDILKLPQKSKRNQQHVRKRGGWTVAKTTVRRVGKKKKRTADPAQVNTAFADAFNHVEVTRDEAPAAAGGP